MALTDAFKLTIDVQLGDSCALPRHKFYQPHMGKQKPKTSIIAQMSAKAVDSLYTRICLRTSKFHDSYS